MFSSLLCPGEGKDSAGYWSIELADASRIHQEYLRNTPILRTEIEDASGNAVEILDFCPRFQHLDRTYRPTAFVRILRPLQGSPRVRVRLAPTANWGRPSPPLTGGSNHLRFELAALPMRLTTNAPVSLIREERWFRVEQPLHFFLGPDESFEGDIVGTVDEMLAKTRLEWREWVRGLAIPLEWQEAVIRAAITLKMSLFEDTGAIVAAMTTSIPEAPGTQRNWDYRYCWLRDAFFVVRALNSLAEVGTMEDYLGWLSNVVVGANGGHVQPLFGIGLERELTERICERLPGYRGMGPVRVGNQAFEHFQHDVYGNIVLGAAQAFHDRRLLNPAGLAEFERLETVGEKAVRIFDQPDAGMWELRTRARVHTSSALMCWAACDRLSKIAHTLQQAERAAYWQKHAEGMRARILRESWSEERQAFAESFGGRDLDASVLLMAEVGFIDPMDPRFVATLDALEKHLCDGPYMRRYEAADDFGKPETAFNICTFWRIDALARIGRVEEARAIFETMLKARNPLGILSEDTHATTGEMWGNYPQTYSMVGIINAAVRLSAAWDTVI